MDPLNPVWRKPPYYVLPDQVRVDCGNYGQRLTAESEMEMNTYENLSNPTNFMFGGAGGRDLTPPEFVQSLIDYARSLKDAPYGSLTAANWNALPRAIFHANLIFDTLKQIQGQGGKSIYDVWEARASA